MGDLTIRPTAKFIMLRTILAVLVFPLVRRICGSVAVPRELWGTAIRFVSRTFSKDSRYS